MRVHRATDDVSFTGVKAEFYSEDIEFLKEHEIKIGPLVRELLHWWIQKKVKVKHEE